MNMKCPLCKRDVGTMVRERDTALAAGRPDPLVCGPEVVRLRNVMDEEGGGETRDAEPGLPAVMVLPIREGAADVNFFAIVAIGGGGGGGGGGREAPGRPAETEGTVVV